MEKQFYANGKLLLTGEYYILNGAKALALPVKYGQSMDVKYAVDSDSFLIWETYIEGKSWFKTTIPKYVSDFPPKGKTETESWLLNLLYAAQHLAGDKNPMQDITNISCNINYNILWGLGSSSGIISNIAHLFDIDPFLLSKIFSDGSGYDIACARENSPILYQLIDGKPVITSVELPSDITKYMYFVYSGRKQNTSQSVKDFKRQKQPGNIVMERISHITEHFTKTETYERLHDYVAEHEEILAKTLDKTPIKKSKFSDFNGEIKSLGAWGGDFYLAITNQGEQYVKDYFNHNNLNVIFSYDNIAV